MYAITLNTIAPLTRNTTAITILTMHHATITTKTSAVQTLIHEDVAGIENNISDTTKAYSTEYVL